MTSLRVAFGNPLARLGGRADRMRIGIMAVSTKELRGRMRGRRAFAVLTVYLVLLALFSWAVYEFQRSAATSIYGQPGYSGVGAPSVALSAQIGQSLFSGLLMIETLLVAVLAPAFTSGAISLEREKQTLDLLVVTPLSSGALVIGKLVSALAYVFVLILSSVPLAAIVFLFGGVGPEDLVRAYLLLAAVAVGYGAIGLFISALVRRTQVATVVTYLTVLALTVGTAVLWAFLYSTSGSTPTTTFVTDAGGASTPVTTTVSRPPQQLLWLNPFVADLDLICATSTSGYDSACSIVGTVTGRPYFGGTFGGVGSCPAGAMCIAPIAPVPVPDVKGGGGVVCTAGACGVAVQPIDPTAPLVQQTASGLPRDVLWPQSAAAFAVTALLLTFVAAQLVVPTRRRPHLPAWWRRPRRRRAPEAAS
jgi:ABC-type transport system involved in multi-copper enzyme maturation permease subunit